MDSTIHETGSTDDQASISQMSDSHDSSDISHADLGPDLFGIEFVNDDVFVYGESEEDMAAEIAYDKDDI